MYVVYLCGCTDCFPSACFLSLIDAHVWADENSKNPEGYLIKYRPLPLIISEEDFK